MEIENLPKTQWSSFKMEDVFLFSKGKRLIKENMIEGKLSFIGAISSNNGVRQFIDETPTHKGNCITVNYNGSVGEAYYQFHDFWASDDVNVLNLRNRDLTPQIALFLCTIIKSNKYRFGYGRKWTLEKMKPTEIILPIDIKNEIDWNYMTDFINSIISNQNLEELVTTKVKKSSLLLETRSWKEFNLVDFFNMTSGKFYYSDEYTNGTTPYVSASNTNNGIMYYINLSPDFDGNCLTIGKVGLSCFYQKNDFCATSDVTILKSNFKFNQFIGLFLATLLNKESFKWSYGRQIRLGDCKELVLKLPTKDNLNPDWDYMEKITKSLSFSDKI